MWEIDADALKKNIKLQRQLNKHYIEEFIDGESKKGTEWFSSWTLPGLARAPQMGSCWAQGVRVNSQKMWGEGRATLLTKLSTPGESEIPKVNLSLTRIK